MALGRLGQKTRGGWYDYAEGSRQPQESALVEPEIRAAAQAVGAQAVPLDETTIQRALLLPMVHEGAKILAEGVALRASDIDLVKIHGYGFPRASGGPMHWGAAQGAGMVQAGLESLAAQGLALPPTDALRHLP